MFDIAKFFLRLGLMLSVPVVIAALTYSYMHDLFFVPVTTIGGNKVLVEIKKGKSFREVGQELVSKGVLKNARALELLVRLKAKGKQINEGEYEVSSSMTPGQMLDKLLSGDVYLRTVSVFPGSSVWEIGKLLEAQGIISETEFNAALSSPDLLKQAGIRAESFEGYFFPGTYSFSRVDTPRQIIWRMMEEAEKHWPLEFTEKADKLELSRHEVLTLASIIQKEASNVEDMSLVSSVFHNRTGVGMKLEADSTVIYGLTNFSGTLSEDDLKNQHLYNTHFYYGLPPGPICNPSVEAIQAAIEPSNTNFLFYVKDGKGRLVFASNHREHEEALKKYKEFNTLKKSANAS